jgi:hypothetical protein
MALYPEENEIGALAHIPTKVRYLRSQYESKQCALEEHQENYM